MDLSRKEAELKIAKQRCRMLDEVLRYKATLAKLTITLEQAEQYTRATRPHGQQHNGNDDATLAVNVHTEPCPRQAPEALPCYIVDEMPEEEALDRVGHALVNGEKQKRKATLADKANRVNPPPPSAPM